MPDPTDDNKVLNGSRDREIERLNNRIAELTGENTRRKGSLRDALKAVGCKDLAELQVLVATHGDYGKLAKDHADLKARSIDRKPTELQAELDDVKGKLRTRIHRDGFAALYADKELGLNPEVNVDRLIKILDYKAESDTFDPAATKKAVAALKASDPYLFGVPRSGDETSTTGGLALQQAPAWSGRGASDQSAGGMVLSDAAHRDPAAMHAYAASLAQGKP
jgi:hypothetical protein